MTDKVISKFQMCSYKILEFHYSTPVLKLASHDNLSHQFAGKYQIEHLEDKWVGMLIIEYSARVKEATEDENNPSLAVLVSSMFDYDAPDTLESKEQFVKMLKTNGAIAVLSTLRGNVAAATSALGRSPCMIVPSVNLNYFDWEEIH